jgi:HAD superfamily hydrolase (TIGR01509 family)
VPHAVVLDFDGVIVNSEPVHLRALQAVLAREGASLSARDYYGRYVGLSDHDTFVSIARDFGLSWDAAVIDTLVTEKSASVQRLLDERSPLFDGAAERIRRLAADLPLAIASGALRPEIEQVLSRARLLDFFGVIIAAGDTPRGKPSPDPYQAAIARLSLVVGRRLDPARSVAVEDTLQGLAAARAAGLKTIAVTTTYPASALRLADEVTTDISGVTIERIRALVSAGSRS